MFKSESKWSLCWNVTLDFIILFEIHFSGLEQWLEIDLGIIFGQSLSFDSHNKSVTHSCFFHLRNIAKGGLVHCLQITAKLSWLPVLHWSCNSRTGLNKLIFTSIKKTFLLHYREKKLSLMQKLKKKNNSTRLPHHRVLNFTIKHLYLYWLSCWGNIHKRIQSIQWVLTTIDPLFWALMKINAIEMSATNRQLSWQLHI